MGPAGRLELHTRVWDSVLRTRERRGRRDAEAGYGWDSERLNERRGKERLIHVLADGYARVDRRTRDAVEIDE